MKSKLFLIPTTLLIISATLISCNNQTNKTTNQQFSSEVKTYDLTKNLTLNGHEITFNRDLALLSTSNYTGQIVNVNQDGYAEITQKQLDWVHNSTMIGSSDSIIWVFNDRDDDGFSIANFAQTHYVEDTSMASTMVDFYQQNYPQGFIKSQFLGGALNFVSLTATKGRIYPWFGSQTNHYTQSNDHEAAFATALDQIKKAYPQTIYETIVQYYQHASHQFIPTIINQNLITYEQIAKNAIKMTFDVPENFSLTAARIHALPQGKKKFDFTHKWNIGPLSIGGINEWEAYHQKPYSDTAFATKYDQQNNLITQKGTNASSITTKK